MLVYFLILQLSFEIRGIFTFFVLVLGRSKKVCSLSYSREQVWEIGLCCVSVFFVFIGFFCELIRFLVFVDFIWDGGR